MTKFIAMSSAALPAPSPDYGGLENIVANVALTAARLGNDVSLFTTVGSSLAGEFTFNDTGGRLRTFTFGAADWSEMSEAEYYNAAAQVIAKEYSDGETVIWDNTWSLLIYMLKRDLPNLKICHTHHGMPGFYLPAEIYPRIMGVSRFHAQLISQIHKIPARHVYNGIHMPAETELADTKDDGFLLSLNRISYEKGIHDAIDIATETRTPIKIVGDDVHVVDQKYVFDIINRCRNSKGMATYYGLVDNDTKKDLLKTCKAVIGCPVSEGPRAWQEAFGLYAVEAMAYGKPVLALQNGGLREIVVHGETGFIAENPENLKQYVAKVGDIDRHKCRKRVEENFTDEIMTKRYLEIFDGISAEDPAYLW